MNKLAEFLEKSGMAQARLAKLAKTSQPQIQRLAAGKRGLSRKWALLIAPHTSLTPEELMFGDRVVPLLGYVEAGSRANYYEESSGPIGVAKMPPGGSEKTVSAQIKGDSLGPLMDRWVVYYDDLRDPPTDDLLDQLCVVCLISGDIYVKQLCRGRDGKHDLVGNNATIMRDQSVKWAALVTAMLPPSAVVEESQDNEEPIARTNRKRVSKKRVRKKTK